MTGCREDGDRVQKAVRREFYGDSTAVRRRFDGNSVAITMDLSVGSKSIQGVQPDYTPETLRSLIGLKHLAVPFIGGILSRLRELLSKLKLAIRERY